MARLTPIKYSLNGGEISPYTLGRTELDKYFTCEEALENCYPLIQGGATRRYGSRYIVDAMGPSRLIPFIFNTSTAYVLEFGNTTLRFYTNDGQILSAGVPYQISTPFNTGTDNLWDIKFVQVGNIMYLVHPKHPPMKLSRITDTNWILTTPSFFAPPTFSFNQDISEGTITVTLSGLTGTVTVTASSPVFIAGDVGRKLIIGSGSGFITAISGTTSVDGTTSATRNQVATITVINSFAAVGPIAAGSWFLAGGPGSYLGIGTIPANWHNTRMLGTGTIQDIYTFTDFPVDNSPAPTKQDTFRAIDGGTYLNVDGAVLLINPVTDAKHITAYQISTFSNIITNSNGSQSPFPASGGSWTLETACFTVTHGYPISVAFFQDRIWFAGTIDQPQTIWGSTTNDFDNFAKGNNADRSLEFTLTSGQFEQVLWLLPFQGNLVAGTYKGEYIITGGGGGGIPNGASTPITPTNVAAILQSLYGVSPIQPLLVQGDLVYVQRSKRNAFQFAFNIYASVYGSKNLNVLHDLITTSGFKEMTYQQNPNYIVWFVDLTGNLVGLTYEKNEQVWAWHRDFTGTDTGDQVISTASIPSPTALFDELWMVCKRIRYNTSGGAPVAVTVYTIELQDNSLFLDCASHTIFGNPVGSLSGLQYLQGRPVSIFADGQFVGTTIPDASGTFTFPPGLMGTDVQAGINYIPKIVTVRPDIPGLNSIQGLTKRWNRIWLRMYKSLNVLINGSLRIFPRTPQNNFGQGVPYQTGDSQTLTSGWDKDGRITITQDEPYPMTVLAVFGEFIIGEN